VPNASASALTLSPISCPIPITLSTELTSARIAVIGGQHGTTEMPRAFAAIACKLLEANRRVNVALEISKSDQPLIDAYLASQGSLDDQKAFLAQPDWSRND